MNFLSKLHFQKLFYNSGRERKKARKVFPVHTRQSGSKSVSIQLACQKSKLGILHDMRGKAFLTTEMETQAKDER